MTIANAYGLRPGRLARVGQVSSTGPAPRRPSTRKVLILIWVALQYRARALMVRTTPAPVRNALIRVCLVNCPAHCLRTAGLRAAAGGWSPGLRSAVEFAGSNRRHASII